MTKAIVKKKPDLWKTKPTFVAMLQRRGLSFKDWIKAEKILAWDHVVAYCERMELIPPPHELWEDAVWTDAPVVPENVAPPENPLAVNEDFVIPIKEEPKVEAVEEPRKSKQWKDIPRKGKQKKSESEVDEAEDDYRGADKD